MRTALKGRSKRMKTLKRYISLFSLVILSVAAGYAQTTLTALDGTRVNVEAQKGKVVVLAIGASWLPLSGKQADYVNAVAKKYQGRDVVVYFVATDSTNPKSKNFASDDAIKSFASTNKLAVPVLRDSDGATTFPKYKVDQVPSFVILDKNGVEAGPPLGGIDMDTKGDQTLRIFKVIDRLLV